MISKPSTTVRHRDLEGDAVQQLLEYRPVVPGACANGALDDIVGELQSTSWAKIVLTFCR